MKTEITQYGFKWGQVEVLRCCSDKKYATLILRTQKGDLQVHVTPTGKIRVSSDKAEWKPAK